MDTANTPEIPVENQDAIPTPAKCSVGLVLFAVFFILIGGFLVIDLLRAVMRS